MSPPALLPRPPRLAIVGGGPAGLMAAQVARAAGADVDLYERMGSVGRKFLLAGKGGLNLTHAEPFAAFVSRYGARRAQVEGWLRDFDAEATRAWARELGVETFVGSSGRVFPSDLKAAPLLRGWVRRLRAQGVRFHMQHRLLQVEPRAGGGFALHFQTPSVLNDGVLVEADAVLLALGGGSWPELGSDGAWVEALRAAGIEVTPLLPANCGFELDWSAHFKQRFAGAPVKPVALRWRDVDGHEHARQGEFVCTAQGVEGGLIYAASGALRDAIARDGHATVHLDLAPGRTPRELATALAQHRGKRSIGEQLRRALHFDGVRAGLVFECLPKTVLADVEQLSQAIKHLPLRLLRPRPLAEAISSAGGVRLEALDEGLMSRAHPGLFCAGEMLDWEAPTGGYLLTACFASGLRAARAALAWLGAQDGYAWPDRIGN